MAKKQSVPRNPQAQATRTVAPTGTQNHFATPNSGTSSYNWMGWAAALLGVLLYMNTIGHSYVLDDYSAIKENIHTKEGLNGIGKIFTSEYRAGSWNSPGTLYRPFTLSMFAMEWQIWPDNPKPGHIINILLYGLTGWILFAVWRRILRPHSALLSGIIALLFTAHPVHTEVVANIKSRDEIMSLLFCTGVLWFVWNYLDTRRITALLAALLCFTIALFSKESSVTWLAVLPLAIWCFRDEPLAKNLQTTAWFLVPFAVFMAARTNALSKQNGKEVFSILDNFMVAQPQYSMKQLAGAFTMCWQYIVALVWPVKQISDRGFPQFDLNHLPTGQGALGFLLIMGGGIWALLRLRQKPVYAFAIITFLATFSLFSNVFIAIGTSYGERLLYLPSLGFAFGLGWFLYSLHQKGSLSTTALYAVLGAIIGLYSLRTVTRNPDWKTSYALYQADYPKSPRCAKLNYHLAIEQAKEALDSTETNVVEPRWLDTSITSYNRALQLYPDYHDCFSGRGLAYFRSQKYDLAFNDYQRALQYRPDDAKVLSNTGYIYFLKNDLAKAEEVYRKSIALDPRFVDARRNLGAVLAMTKRFPEAIEQFEAGLKYDPRSAILYFYIGSAYRDMGQAEKGLPFLEKAYAMNPALRPK
jgi:protein O-mannosyl-transferase